MTPFFHTLVRSQDEEQPLLYKSKRKPTESTEQAKIDRTIGRLSLALSVNQNAHFQQKIVSKLALLKIYKSNIRLQTCFQQITDIVIKEKRGFAVHA